ncbi:SufE family protein [Phaeocystidibacter luteus]|uniref:SufE family protein n=1 Tax=Phaeocystidibacter luteus TaxID=911197 RepID=A0A6N6RKV8_9FLAO|nr:SufE family protein [Phaeocystidibacter luteus]KAB2813959.1 SufE family protein [Phaeocystidibacter luteus]
MSESIQERTTDIVDEFDMFEDWMDKYDHIISLGKELPLIDEQHKVDDNLIKGCQSRVWLHADYDGQNVTFTADSDAIITKGIIALMVRVLSGQSPEAIVNADLSFVDEIGLKDHLSPTRANGLVSMIKQMKFYALAYQSK